MPSDLNEQSKILLDHPVMSSESQRFKNKLLNTMRILLENNLFMMTTTAGLLLSSAISLYYFIARLGLKDVSVSLGYSIIAQVNGTEMSLYLSDCPWDQMPHRNTYYTNCMLSDASNFDTWTTNLPNNTFFGNQTLFVQGFLVRAVNALYTNMAGAWSPDSQQRAINMSQVILDKIAALCLLTQTHSAVFLNNVSETLFSNSTMYNTSIPQADPTWNPEFYCQYPLINALNITFNFFTENVAYTRVLKPAVIAGAFFCLSLAALALLWKSRQVCRARFEFSQASQNRISDESRNERVQGLNYGSFANA